MKLRGWVACGLVGFVVSAVACSSSDAGGADGCASTDAAGPCEGSFPCSNGGISLTCPKNSVCAISAGSVTCLPGAASTCISPAQAGAACIGGTRTCSGSASTGITVNCTGGGRVGGLPTSADGGTGTGTSSSSGGTATVDPEADACKAVDAAPPTAIVTDPFIYSIDDVSTDSIYYYSNEGSAYRSVAKTGGSPKTVYTWTAQGAFPGGFRIGPDGKGYVLSLVRTEPTKFQLMQVDLGTAQSTEIASLPGYAGIETMIGTTADKLYFFLELGGGGTSAGANEGSGVWSYTPSTNTLVRLAKLDSAGSYASLGIHRGKIWLSGYGTIVAVDPTSGTVTPFTPDTQLTTAAGSPSNIAYVVGDTATYAYDNKGTWYELDNDTLATKSIIDADPLNVNGNWVTAWTTSGSFIYGIQRPTSGSGISKLKAIPVKGGAAHLYSCDIDVYDVLVDDADVYYVTTHGLVRSALQ